MKTKNSKTNKDEKVFEKQESKNSSVIINVDYINVKGDRKRDSFRTDIKGVRGYALFFNLIMANSLMSGNEFSINVQKDE